MCDHPVLSLYPRKDMTDLHEHQVSHHIPAIEDSTHQAILPESVWRDIPAMTIACSHPRSSGHHPKTTVKLAWDKLGLHMRFDVRDRYVLCRNLRRQSNVCQDSCVEAFLMPIAGKGYLNFEFNIAGAMLVYHIKDPTLGPNGLANYVRLTDEDMNKIHIHTDGHGMIDPEIKEPLDWQITCNIPWELFERYVGPMTINSQTVWRGNFYKCADHSSHPHWLSWQPIGEKLSFHQPQTFGILCFEEHRLSTS